MSDFFPEVSDVEVAAALSTGAPNIPYPPTFASRGSQSLGDDIETALDIIEANGGAGGYEQAPGDPDTIERWDFPRFPGATEPGDLYRSRTGLGPHDTDVETVAAWLEAPRNIVGAILLEGEPGTGKLLPMETPIPTPTGWTTMGELQPGDYVIGRDGKPTRVVFASTVEQQPDLYDLHFSDGSVVTACADHQWVASNRRDRLRGTEQVATTQQMLDAGVRVLRSGDGRVNWAVRVAAPLDLPKADLLVDPYVLGVWLGDGGTDRNMGRITTMDSEIVKAVVDAGYKQLGISQHPNNRAATYTFDGLGWDLSVIGVGNGRAPLSTRFLGWRYGATKAKVETFGKHIPAEYMRASYKQRLALLQGLMDTDGTVSRNGQCELSLSDQTLALNALDLIRTLGIKATMTTNPSSYKNLAGERVVCKDRHRIHFTTTQPVFRLERKASRLPKTVRPTTQWLYIEQIVPVQSRPGKCIQVDNEDSTYLCTEAYIPTHNTSLAQAAATHADRKYDVLTATPDHTRDSLFMRFVGEGKGEDGTAFVKAALVRAAEQGLTLIVDEFMLFVDGVKPLFYPLMDGNHFLPEANVDGTAMPIHPDTRIIITSNPSVRGASLPEPIASRCAGTTLTVETSAAMLRDLDIADDIVAAWQALGNAGLWRPQIREMRVANYWLDIDPAQAVSAFVPGHAPESQREQIRNTVVSFLGGTIRTDGRLVVS